MTYWYEHWFCTIDVVGAITILVQLQATLSKLLKYRELRQTQPPIHEWDGK